LSSDRQNQHAREKIPVVSVAQLPRPERTVAETNRPHCFFDIRVGQAAKTVRVVIRLRPDQAPFMSENFIKLCQGGAPGGGGGYKGCRFFRCKPDEQVVTGDFENQNGTGGRCAFETGRYFLAEQCPLKDHKGAVRMRGIERTPEGRCKVGSQFMVWVGDIDYKVRAKKKCHCLTGLASRTTSSLWSSGR